MSSTTATLARPQRIQLELPSALYQWLSSETQRRGVILEQLVYLALEHYAASEGITFDIAQTRTWQLSGALEVAEPEPEYISGWDEHGGVVTNYAEHVDDLLYRGG